MITNNELISLLQTFTLDWILWGWYRSMGVLIRQHLIRMFCWVGLKIYGAIVFIILVSCLCSDAFWLTLLFKLYDCQRILCKCSYILLQKNSFAIISWIQFVTYFGMSYTNNFEFEGNWASRKGTVLTT